MVVDLAELKRINAWLQAAAAARTQADEGYVFELFALPAEGTVEDALARYTAGTNWQVSVSDATWSEVEAALGLWFGETAEASEVLGFDLWALCQNGPAEDLNATVNTQPAMLVAGVSHVVPEAVEMSLALGEATLRNIGIEDDRVGNIAGLLRADDYADLRHSEQRTS